HSLSLLDRFLVTKFFHSLPSDTSFAVIKHRELLLLLKSACHFHLQQRHSFAFGLNRRESLLQCGSFHSPLRFFNFFFHLIVVHHPSYHHSLQTYLIFLSYF